MRDALALRSDFVYQGITSPEESQKAGVGGRGDLLVAVVTVGGYIGPVEARRRMV